MTKQSSGGELKTNPNYYDTYNFLLNLRETEPNAELEDYQWE